MKEVKGSSKLGQRLIEKGTHWEADFLSQIYGTWSEKKEKAYQECREKYYDTPNHSAWGICCHNSWGFSASWCGTYHGESIMRMETPNSSFMVFLER